MGFAKYDNNEYGKINTAEIDKPVPEGIYTAVVKALATGTTRNGRDVLKWDLKITGPDCIGKMLFLNDYPDTPEGRAKMKRNCEFAGGGHVPINEMDNPIALKCMIGAHLEVSVKHTLAKDGSEKLFVNAYIRRRVAGAAAPLSNGGNGTHAAAGVGAGNGAGEVGDEEVPF